MKKYIVIARCGIEIDFAGGKAKGSRPGGALLRMAADIARNDSEGAQVVMVSEVSMDEAGDIITDYLEKAGVDTRSIDRYADGVTPVNLNFVDGKVVEYQSRRSDEFDTVWPRIDAGDVVVFGGRFALEDRVRRQLGEIIDFARTRKAKTVYVMQLRKEDVPRATRVMPAILDNLDNADLTIATPTELKLVFGDDDPTRCYSNHVSFHCGNLVVRGECESLHYARGKEPERIDTSELPELIEL